MPIAKSHSEADRSKRKGKDLVLNGKAFPKKTIYAEVDAVIDKVYVDIVNGVLRGDIIKRLQDGTYGRVMKQRNANDYYNAALSRFTKEKDVEADKLRAVYYARFEKLYRDAVEKKDVYNANNVLQSICRIFGLEEKNMPQTLIQLNNNKDGITVNFGFNNGDNEANEVNED